MTSDDSGLCAALAIGRDVVRERRPWIKRQLSNWRHNDNWFIDRPMRIEAAHQAVLLTSVKNVGDGDEGYDSVTPLYFPFPHLGWFTSRASRTFRISHLLPVQPSVTVPACAVIFGARLGPRAEQHGNSSPI